MNRAELVRRQRCRALLVAAALGIFLAVFSAIGRDWIPAGVGLAGTAIALAVHRRRCGDVDDERS